MKEKEIYEIYYPFEEGHGGKFRPVLVFILTSIKDRFIGLKITGTERVQNRVEIQYWETAGLNKQSYIQCNNYSVFEFQDESFKYIGTLAQSDYDRVVLKFNEFYQILD